MKNMTQMQCLLLSSPWYNQKTNHSFSILVSSTSNPKNESMGSEKSSNTMGKLLYLKLNHRGDPCFKNSNFLFNQWMIKLTKTRSSRIAF